MRSIATLAEAHLAWLELRRSPQTAGIHRCAYKHLARFLAARAERHLEQITPPVADAFARYLRDRGLSPASVFHYVKSLRALATWAEAEGYTRRSRLGRYTLPSAKETPATGFTHGQLEAPIQGCGEGYRGRRNLAILLVLYDTAIRASELVDLRLADLDLQAQTLLIRRAKGNKTRTVSFSKATAGVLRKYVLKHHPAPEDEALPLFCGRGTKPLTRDGLRGIVHDLAVAAGITGKRLSPHSIRHAALTQSLVNGSNLRFAQLLAGHTSIRTTQRYLDLFSE